MINYCVGPILPSINGKILLFKIGFEISDLGKKENFIIEYIPMVFNYITRYVRVYSTGI